MPDVWHSALWNACSLHPQRGLLEQPRVVRPPFEQSLSSLRIEQSDLVWGRIDQQRAFDQARRKTRALLIECHQVAFCQAEQKRVGVFVRETHRARNPIEVGPFIETRDET